MEVKTKHEEKKPVSVLQGDGFCINKILAREPSIGQSSHIFYRAAEGVPFKWEMRPGTPKNPQEVDAILPPCPSPLMQSLGLPLPNLDHDESKESALKSSKIWRLKTMVKERINSDIIKKVEVLVSRRFKRQESWRFGDSNGEFVDKDLSFSSQSSSSFFSANIPFCCSPLNVSAVLEEGNTRIYYCSHHKTVFAVEEDGSYHSRILSRVSAGEQFSGPLNNGISPAGVPFGWEMQPGTSKTPPENELIPRPSPPPAAQSSYLRWHDDEERTEKSARKRVLFWKRCHDEKKESGKTQHEISFRYNEKMEISSSDEGFDASFRESSFISSLSSVAPLSKGDWSVSKIRRNLQGRCLRCVHWSSRDILVFARRKFKSLTSKKT